MVLISTGLSVRAEADGLILNYDFSQAAGETVEDLSSSQHDGELMGGASIADEGTSGNVLELDGVSGMVTISGLDGLRIKDGLTISAVVRFDDADSPDSAGMIIWKPECFLFGRNGEGHLYFNIYSGVDPNTDDGWLASPVSNEPIPTGEFVHVAVTVEKVNDGAGVNGYQSLLWVNGQIVTDKKYNNVVFPENDNPVDIGKGWGGPWFFKGQMQSIQIYDRALTAQEIQDASNDRK